jgi:hypothetical protein
MNQSALRAPGRNAKKRPVLGTGRFETLRSDDQAD